MTDQPVAGFDRITFDPLVMGGKPCIRGMRVTAGMIVGSFAAGVPRERLLEAYPYLEDEDITQALGYAAWQLRGGEAADGAEEAIFAGIPWRTIGATPPA